MSFPCRSVKENKKNSKKRNQTVYDNENFDGGSGVRLAQSRFSEHVTNKFTTKKPSLNTFSLEYLPTCNFALLNPLTKKRWAPRPSPHWFGSHVYSP